MCFEQTQELQVPVFDYVKEHKWWKENFDLERIDTRVRKVMARFLKHREANWVGYRLIPDSHFDTGMVPGLDSPRKELIHQIRNTIMRVNVLQERDIFDFTGYPEINPKTAKDILVEVYRNTTQNLFELFTLQNGSQQNPNINKTIQWFNQQLTWEDILDRAREHEVGHYFVITSMLAVCGIRWPAEYRLWG